jgi:hypothetical protein
MAMWTSATKRVRATTLSPRPIGFISLQDRKKKATTKERAVNLGQVAPAQPPATGPLQRPGSMHTLCQHLNKPIADCPEVVCFLGTPQITH